MNKGGPTKAAYDKAYNARNVRCAIKHVLS